MRKILFSVVLMATALVAQAADITPVTNAFKAGNAELLKDFMASEVDIVMPGVSKKGDSSNAITMLKSFFQKNKPTNFTIAHHANKNGSGFLVGRLTTADKEFRVNITYTTKDDKLNITVIRIE